MYKKDLPEIHMRFFLHSANTSLNVEGLSDCEGSKKAVPKFLSTCMRFEQHGEFPFDV